MRLCSRSLKEAFRCSNTPCEWPAGSEAQPEPPSPSIGAEDTRHDPVDLLGFRVYDLDTKEELGEVKEVGNRC